MKRLLISALMLLVGGAAFAQPAIDGATYAATQYTVTSGTIQSIAYEDFGPTADEIVFRIVTIDWTSSAGGAVLTTVPAQWGRIVGVITDPDGGGDAPDDNYDIELQTSGGLDYFANLAQNRDTANVEVVAPKFGNGTGEFGLTSPTEWTDPFIAGVSTLVITAAGNANKGILQVVIAK